MTARFHAHHQEQASPLRVAQSQPRAVLCQCFEFFGDPFHGREIARRLSDNHCNVRELLQ